MQHYPVEDYIYGDYAMTGMCQQSIDTLLGYLNPTNCRIIRVGKAWPTNTNSHWYQVPYQMEDIPKEKLDYWANIPTNNDLHLPEKNSYIVEKPRVYDHKVETDIPEIITDDNGLKVWFKQDTTFKVPKGYIYIGIDSPFAIQSAENIAMTRLFVDLYSDSVIEKHYDAELAGIHYHLYSHQGGVTLQLSGLSTKQPLLLTELLNDLQSFELVEQRFELIREQLITHWKNADKSKSISQLFSTLSSLMQPNNPTSASLSIALESITFETFVEFSKKLFTQVTIEALIHGNWLKEQAIKISNLIDKTFKDNHSKNFQVQCPVIDISDEREALVPVYMPQHDHAAVIYYPYKSRDFKSTALIMLVSHLLAPLFFEEMRTEKQYGYLVNVGYIPINRYPGMAFYIQSPNVEPDVLVNEINSFIEHWRSKVAKIPEEQWQFLKQGLAGQLMEKDTSLRIKSQRFWGAICNQDFEFNHKQKMIDTILNVQRSDLEALITENQKQPNDSEYRNRITLVSSLQDVTTFNTNTTLSGQVIANCDEFTKNCKRKY